MNSLLSPSHEKYVLAYSLFATAIILVVVSAIVAAVRPWTGTLVAILTFPANAFIQMASGVRTPAGVMGDVFLIVELGLAFVLAAAYLYVIASVLVWARDSLPKSGYSAHKRSYR